jgi:hypothetical protein
MFIRRNRNEKDKTGRFGIRVFTVLFMLVFMLRTGFCLAGQEAQNIPDNPLDIVSIMTESLTPPVIAEALPVPESLNDGYWWIKQSRQDKLSYIEHLIKAFNLQDKGINPAQVIDELNVFYDPMDDPVDIKMDISLERAFNRMIKELQKGAS